MNHADELRDKLNKAISNTTLFPGFFTDDIRNFSRNRKLSQDLLIRLLLTMTGGPLNRELYDAGVIIAQSSFVERRKKLVSSCLQKIMKQFNELCDDPATIKGYQLWAIDGSTVPLPRNPKSGNHYESETNPKGWNNIHCNLLLDIPNHVFIDCNVGGGDSRKSHDEQGTLFSLIYRRKIYQPTIVALDRGYEGYNTLAHLLRIANLYFVLRVKQDKGALRPVRDLPMEELDRDLEWTITTRQTNEAKENGWIFLQTGSKKGKMNSPNTRITRWDFGHIDPLPQKCRAVRLKLDTGDFETLLTNLPRDEFSLSDLREIYAMRWQIETNIRFWKYAVGTLALHSRTDDLILQELYAHLIMFNFCHRICCEIKIPQKPGNKYRYEIDKTMAIYLAKKFFREPDFTGEKLISDIKRYTQPVRPNRADERNLKVKTFSGFPYRIPS